MRMEVQLPTVEPETCHSPERCPYAECDGEHFKRHGVQGEKKVVRDLHHDTVLSYRWRCLKCGRRFRVYPPAVSGAQQMLDNYRKIVALVEESVGPHPLPDELAAATADFGEVVDRICR